MGEKIRQITERDAGLGKQGKEHTLWHGGMRTAEVVRVCEHYYGLILVAGGKHPKLLAPDNNKCAVPFHERRDMSPETLRKIKNFAEQHGVCKNK